MDSPAQSHSNDQIRMLLLVPCGWDQYACYLQDEILRAQFYQKLGEWRSNGIFVKYVSTPDPLAALELIRRDAEEEFPGEYPRSHCLALTSAKNVLATMDRFMERLCGEKYTGAPAPQPLPEVASAPTRSGQGKV